MTATVASLPPLRPTLVGASRVWMRDWTVYRHVARWLLIPSFADPLLFLLALGFGLGAYLEGFGDIAYIDFIAPGLMASSTMFQASFETTWNVLFKIDTTHTYDAIVATPVEPADVVLGDTLWAASRATITATALFIVLIVFGLLHSPWAVFMPAAAFLNAWCFAAMGMLFTSYATSMNVFAYYYSMAITPMFLLSGVFFPIDQLPDWAQAAAQALPLYHGAALLRDLSFGTVGASDLWHLTYLVTLPLVLFIPTARRMARRIVD